MEAREVRMRCLEAAVALGKDKPGIHQTPAGVLTAAREFENYVISAAESGKEGTKANPR